MSIIPANEALVMQEAKRKKYEEEIFEKVIEQGENQFNRNLKGCHRDHTSLDIPRYFWPYHLSDKPEEQMELEESEYLELVERVKKAGYYVVPSNWYPSRYYTAYFKHPEPKKAWWKIW